MTLQGVLKTLFFKASDAGKNLIISRAEYNVRLVVSQGAHQATPRGGASVGDLGDQS